MKSFRLPERDNAAVIVFEDVDDEAFLTLLTWIVYGTNSGEFTRLALQHNGTAPLPHLRHTYSLDLYKHLQYLQDEKSRTPR